APVAGTASRSPRSMSMGSMTSRTTMSPDSQCLPTTREGTAVARDSRDAMLAVYSAPYVMVRMLSLMPPSTATYSLLAPSSSGTLLVTPTVYSVMPAGPAMARPGSIEIRGQEPPVLSSAAATASATVKAACLMSISSPLSTYLMA